jgi:hypothetical protein
MKKYSTILKVRISISEVRNMSENGTSFQIRISILNHFTPKSNKKYFSTWIFDVPQKLENG